MRLNIRALIEYHDTPSDIAVGDKPAGSAVFGEELGVQLLLKHLQETHPTIEPHKGPVSRGGTRGPRLDAWLHVPGERWFQVEIKSWSSHSLDGDQFPLDEPDMPAKVQKRWGDYRRMLSDYDPLKKVTIRMTPPAEASLPVYAIACLWDPVHPEGKLEPWFEVAEAVPADGPDSLYVFSMSLYLRGLLRAGQTELILDMKHTERRLQQLQRMLTP